MAVDMTSYLNRKREEKEQGMFMVKVWVFGILFFALFIMAGSIYQTIHIIKLNHKASSWPTVTGQIIKSVRNVHYVNRGTNSSNPEPRHFPDIAYSYSVEGREYSSQQFSVEKPFSFLEYNDKEPALAILKEYPKGREVKVHYNPADIGYSILDLTPATWWYYIPMALAILVASLFNLGFFAKGDMLGAWWKAWIGENLPFLLQDKKPHIKR
jgi:hypothetical protein